MYNSDEDDKYQYYQFEWNANSRSSSTESERSSSEVSSGDDVPSESSDTSDFGHEAVCVGNDILMLPTDVVTKPIHLEQILTMKNFMQYIPPDDFFSIYDYLPNFPKDNLYNKKVTLEKLLRGDKIQFGVNPLSDFCDKLKTAFYQNEILEARNSLTKAKETLHVQQTKAYGRNILSDSTIKRCHMMQPFQTHVLKKVLENPSESILNKKQKHYDQSDDSSDSDLSLPPFEPSPVLPGGDGVERLKSTLDRSNNKKRKLFPQSYSIPKTNLEKSEKLKQLMTKRLKEERLEMKKKKTQKQSFFNNSSSDDEGNPTIPNKKITKRNLKPPNSKSSKPMQKPISVSKKITEIPKNDKPVPRVSYLTTKKKKEELESSVKQNIIQPPMKIKTLPIITKSKKMEIHEVTLGNNQYTLQKIPDDLVYLEDVPTTPQWSTLNKTVTLNAINTKRFNPPGSRATSTITSANSIINRLPQQKKTFTVNLKNNVIEKLKFISPIQADNIVIQKKQKPDSLIDCMDNTESDFIFAPAQIITDLGEEEMEAASAANALLKSEHMDKNLNNVWNSGLCDSPSSSFKWSSSGDTRNSPFIDRSLTDDPYLSMLNECDQFGSEQNILYNTESQIMKPRERKGIMTNRNTNMSFSRTVIPNTYVLKHPMSMYAHQDEQTQLANLMELSDDTNSLVEYG